MEIVRSKKQIYAILKRSFPAMRENHEIYAITGFRGMELSKRGKNKTQFFRSLRIGEFFLIWRVCINKCNLSLQITSLC